MNVVDRLIRMAARLAVGVFFREVEVIGADRVPDRGPVLFVANHVNSLVDPTLLLARLPRRARFLAKSTLWKNPFVSPFLVLAGAIPVYRHQDQGVDTTRNVETFDRCHQALATGGCIALFPEGMSHDEPRLQPLRTGVARIALEAEQRHGPLGLRIVPVGLIFDDKNTFRSRALVLVGEELAPIEGAGEGPAADAVRRLTQRVADGLVEVTPNYRSWRDARVVEQAASLFARPLAEDTRRTRLAESFPLEKAFREGLEELKTTDPAAVNALFADIRRYGRLLRVAGLRDEQVAARYSSPLIARYLFRTTLTLLVWLPMAVVGTVIHWLPYRLVAEVARRAAPTPDTRATYKLFSSIFLFPSTWLLWSTAAWCVAGWHAAAAALVAVPLSGYAALRFHEQRVEVIAEARAYLLLRSGRRAVAELARRRYDLVDRIYDLVDAYRARNQEGSPS